MLETPCIISAAPYRLQVYIQVHFNPQNMNAVELFEVRTLDRRFRVFWKFPARRRVARATDRQVTHLCGCVLCCLFQFLWNYTLKDIFRCSCVSRSQTWFTGGRIACVSETMMQTYLPETEDLLFLHLSWKLDYATFYLCHLIAFRNVIEIRHHRSLIHPRAIHSSVAIIMIKNGNALHVQSNATVNSKMHFSLMLDSSFTKPQ